MHKYNGYSIVYAYVDHVLHVCVCASDHHQILFEFEYSCNAKLMVAALQRCNHTSLQVVCSIRICIFSFE